MKNLNNYNLIDLETLKEIKTKELNSIDSKNPPPFIKAKIKQLRKEISIINRQKNNIK